MKIALAYHRHGWDRGIERKSAELAEHFARAGHAVEYVCTRAEPRPGSAVRFTRVPPSWGPTSFVLGTFDLLARRALRHTAHDLSLSFGSVIGCDIVSAESCHRAGLQARAGWKGGRAEEGVNLGLADRVRLRIERANYAQRRYSRIVACSRRVKRELQEHYRVPASDVSVVSNGVDLEEFSPAAHASARASLREKLGYRADDVVLLFAGNEFARKGLRTAISALAHLEDQKIQLLVCGSGVSRTYERLARELGVAGRVHFSGHMRRVAPYFAASDVLVLPTLHEAFGLVILEAMAMGMAVVVSAEAGAAEDHIVDGREGLLLRDPSDPTELAQKIRLLLGRGDLGRSFGNAGRMKANSLSWEACANGYLEVLKGVWDGRWRETRSREEGRRCGLPSM